MVKKALRFGLSRLNRIVLWLQLYILVVYCIFPLNVEDYYEEDGLVKGHTVRLKSLYSLY